MRKLILFFILLAIFPGMFSQKIVSPNFALKSHPTLEIKSIEASAGKTVISLSIENRITGGRFCADRNIVIIYPDGSRTSLRSSNGIPVCPDAYKFKRVGEKLDFTLTFPPLKQGTQWFDLVEECSDNCFSFLGITVDVELNKRIDEVVSLAENNENARAIDGYKKLLVEIEGKNIGMEGALYSDLITLLMKSGESEEAEKFFDRMKLSNSPSLEKHIKNLNSRGIKF